MKFSRRWCAEFIDGDLPAAADLARALTGRGFEVDSTAACAVNGGVVAGQILQTRPHPNAERLRLCEVDVGGARAAQIVCGAPNAREGMRVAAALPGAVVGGGKIAARKIRGVESAGMLCSAAELGLGAGSDGIVELQPDDDAANGEPLDDLLLFNDDILETGITPNRGDCLSHLGLAREISALCAAPLKMPQAPPPVAKGAEGQTPVSLQAPNACPYYACLPARDANCAAAAPLWMQTRLWRCGARPIAAMVDITNYLMLAYGQPLHAFDSDALQGGIVVRFAKAGEELRLLDGSNAVCAADDLLIADEKKPVALGGVMGGEQTGVTAKTRNVLFEAAHFTPPTTRGKARKFGIASDAAFRFERGADPALPPLALARAAELARRICGGKAGALAAAGAPPPPVAPFNVCLRRARKLLGIKISSQQALEFLNQLHLPAAVVDGDGDTLRVAPPSWRFDVSCEADVAEELARAFGYENLPETLPAGGRMLPPPAGGHFAPARARAFFAGRGFYEAITYSFVSPQTQAAAAAGAPLPLQNPMSQETAVMRSTLLGGLIDSAVYNARRKRERVFLFEVGRVFLATKKASANEPPPQPVCVGGIAAGAQAAAGWAASARAVDFFDIKGALEDFFAAAGGAEFAPAQKPPPAFHPGKTAEVFFAGKAAGWAGELHPAHPAAGEFRGAPLLFELNLDAIAAAAPERQNAAVAAVSRLPEVSRDLALLVKKDIAAGRLLACARAAAQKTPIVEARLFDFYPMRGDNTASYGLRLTLQGDDATLNGDAIAAAVKQVADALQRQCGATLRDSDFQP